MHDMTALGRMLEPYSVFWRPHRLANSAAIRLKEETSAHVVMEPRPLLAALW